jgi:hypothetical protein
MRTCLASSRLLPPVRLKPPGVIFNRLSRRAAAHPKTTDKTNEVASRSQEVQVAASGIL